MQQCPLATSRPQHRLDAPEEICREDEAETVTTEEEKVEMLKGKERKILNNNTGYSRSWSSSTPDVFHPFIFSLSYSITV